MIYWIVGPPASGKSTLADLLSKAGFTHLDGDELRKQLSPDLGWSKSDVIEHHQRIIKSLDTRQNLIVTTCAPYPEVREMIKEVAQLVVMDTPGHVCKERDTKGIYKNFEVVWVT